MQRFLIFTLLGPLLGIIGTTLLIATPDDLTDAALRGFVHVAYTSIYFSVIMTLLAWACELVLINGQVKLPARMITIGGGVAVLTSGLYPLSLVLFLIAVMLGVIAAFCVWLSDRVQQRKQNV